MWRWTVIREKKKHVSVFAFLFFIFILYFRERYRLGLIPCKIIMINYNKIFYFILNFILKPFKSIKDVFQRTIKSLMDSRHIILF